MEVETLANNSINLSPHWSRIIKEINVSPPARMPSLTHFYVALDFIGLDEFNPLTLYSVESSSPPDSGFNQRI